MQTCLKLLKLSGIDLPETKPSVATHIIVFMIRGIHTNVSLPFIWYPCTGFISENLWHCVWKATHVFGGFGTPSIKGHGFVMGPVLTGSFSKSMHQ